MSLFNRYIIILGALRQLFSEHFALSGYIFFHKKK